MVKGLSLKFTKLFDNANEMQRNVEYVIAGLNNKLNLPLPDDKPWKIALKNQDPTCIWVVSSTVNKKDEKDSFGVFRH